MASYNPMSYHNGSVWPHDNSLAVAGLYRYGQREAAETIVTGLLGAAEFDPDWRLPELYCGYPRTGVVHERPVAYPVSCNPQAWASGAFPLILRAMLGLQVDPATRSLVFAPQLPEWIGSVEISGVQVLGGTETITITPF
jgi:glycogen debranching enzyme